jgi:hypothetical protein
MPAAKKPVKKAAVKKEASPQVKSALEKALERANENPAVKQDETSIPEEHQMTWPLPVYPLVAKFDVQVVELEDTQAIVLAIYTGAGATFGLLSREGTIALAQKLKKAGNTMTPGPVK